MKQQESFCLFCVELMVMVGSVLCYCELYEADYETG